jgi:peptidoglycan/LPS O-acetylase OafA/YrhL
MTLAGALNRENNNFDLLRLIAACLVIVGHAHALVPDDSSHDLVLTWLNFDYSGSLAVKFFFFLSGLVVTNSLLEKPSLGAFAQARLFRLMPAMIVCVLLTAFVLGPVVTSLPLAEYFSDRRTGSYVIRNIVLITQSDLPGVFAGHRNPAVNGSLWTLPFEVLCYLGLAVLGWFGLARRRSICSAVMIAVIAYAIVTYAVTVGSISLPFQLPVTGFRGLEVRLLPPCFAFGALLALNKHRVLMRFWIFGSLCVLCAISRGTGLFQFVFYVALFYGGVLAATTAFMKRLRPPGDFSYGVYLYGFPIQQLMVLAHPSWSAYENQAAALAAALLIGCCSWFLIERPCIRAGRRRTALSRAGQLAQMRPEADYAEGG